MLLWIAGACLWLGGFFFGIEFSPDPKPAPGMSRACGITEATINRMQPGDSLVVRTDDCSVGIVRVDNELGVKP